MNSRQIFNASLYVILFMSIVGCSNIKNETTTDKEETPSVKIEKISIQSIERNIEYTGTILPDDEYQLCAAAPGKVQQILVEIGDKVAKGQTLVILDQTQYFQVKVQFETLKLDLQRMDTLLTTGSVAKQKYDQLKAQYDIAKANLEFLEKNTTLKSPIGGEITGKYLNDGEIYSMAPNRETGKPGIVTIMNIEKVKIIVGVSEAYYPVMKRGMKSDVKLDIYHSKKFNGHISKIHPTIDRMTRTFNVEIVIENADKSLKPGMFARVKLQMGSEEALAVPAVAVLKQAGTNERYVFTYMDGKAIRKVVTIGNILDDNVEVLTGLSENERVIVAGHTTLLHQAEVTLVE